MSERVCARFRCPYYKKNNINDIGVTNCGGNGWTNSCMQSCTFRNYAMLLNCTFENPSGDYVQPDGGNS
jgi:hypothetical protein